MSAWIPISLVKIKPNRLTRDKQSVFTITHTLSYILHRLCDPLTWTGRGFQILQNRTTNLLGQQHVAGDKIKATRISIPLMGRLLFCSEVNIKLDFLHWRNYAHFAYMYTLQFKSKHPNFSHYHRNPSDYPCTKLFARSTAYHLINIKCYSELSVALVVYRF